MKKTMKIQYYMFILITIILNNFNINYASIENEVQSIESEIIDESKMEPEWLEPMQESNARSETNNAKSRGEGIHLLGNCKGLTYYSQADSRWANKLYTSTNNTSQTMKSSGCGPTAAAIVVSSSIGNILPPVMANLFVENGFRTPNNGTAWSAFPFIANYFAFNNYEYTTNMNTALSYLRKGYYIIVSCGNGLFTTNGHYIVLVGINNDTLSIYDTYMYNGKFDIPSRNGKVTISGNTIYCSIENFIKYSNYRAFWCYSNDYKKNNITNSNVQYSAGTYQVTTKSLPLRVRKGPGTNYRIVGRLKKGNRVSINYTNGNWGHLSNNTGWIYLKYCTKVNSNNYIPGIYRVTTKVLRVRTGPSTNYRIKTRVYLNSRQKIDRVKGNWGHLSNGKGWICLNYCKIIK